MAYDAIPLESCKVLARTDVPNMAHVFCESDGTQPCRYPACKVALPGRASSPSKPADVEWSAEFEFAR